MHNGKSKLDDLKMMTNHPSLAEMISSAWDMEQSYASTVKDGPTELYFGEVRVDSPMAMSIRRWSENTPGGRTAAEAVLADGSRSTAYGIKKKKKPAKISLCRQRHGRNVAQEVLSFKGGELYSWTFPVALGFKLCLCCEVVLGGSLVEHGTQPSPAAKPRACNYVNRCLCCTHWSNRRTKRITETTECSTLRSSSHRESETSQDPESSEPAVARRHQGAHAHINTHSYSIVVFILSW